MKASRILMSVFALAALVGCSQNHEENEVVGGGEVEKSYLSVNIKSTESLTRADEVYEDGTADEKSVSSAHFFFFDNNGTPVSVNGNNNYIKKDLKVNNNDPAKDNIESVGGVLVLEKAQTALTPTQMVVVLNWDYNSTSLGLAALKNTLIAESKLHNGGKNFLMSNAVYYDTTNSVVKDAVAITEANLADSQANAVANPVTVYVERLAARVTVAAASTKLVPSDAESQIVAGAEIQIAILGWDLVSTQPNTKMVKAINPTWTDVALGFAWNNPTHFRSYWAVSEQGGVNSNFTYDSLTNTIGQVEYCGEHADATSDLDHTKVVIAAQLQKKSTGEPFELAQWYGYNYAGTTSLLAAVAPTLAHNLMHKDGNTYTAIDDDQLKCVGDDSVDSYEVIFKLADGVSTNDWYSYDGVNYTPVTDPNAVLAAIEPARIYKSGKTYYSVDIKHLADDRFGVIRNHSYKINITGVIGLGTPVYDPALKIETPEVPVDEYTYLQSTINVLAWRLIEQNTVLGN